MKHNFKSGFVTLIGRPNVGKSTLMNHLIGQKIAITSHRPQTTRNRIQTVYTSEEGQIVFVDTPGIHKAKNKLGNYMVRIAERTLTEVDVVLWLVEPTTFIGAGEKVYAGMVVGQNGKAEDIELNVCKTKKLTNTRSSSADEALKLTPPRILSLEQCLEFIDTDELLEITPKSLRIRKKILDPTLRKRASMNK